MRSTPAAARVSIIWSATVRVMIFSSIQVLVLTAIGSSSWYREVARHSQLTRPGWLVQTGRKAWVDLFGIVWCDGFRWGKGYGRPILIADPWHAGRRRA